MSAAILDIDCYTIHSWMRSELNLKGNKRDIYAIIYQQSQGGCSYNGSTQALADVVGISKRQVITILSELVNEGLLVKKEHIKNKLKYCEYRAVRKSGEKISPVLQKSGEEISPVLTKSGEETSPPLYIYNNNINNNILSKKVRGAEKPKTKRKSFDEILEDKIPDIRVRAAMQDFIQVRSLNNKKLTNRSLELIIKDLYLLSSDPKDQVKIIERSVKNSWTEFYALPIPKQIKPAADDKTNKPGFTNFSQRDTNMAELEKAMFKT